MSRGSIFFLIAATFTACSFPAAAQSEPTKTVGNAPTKGEYDKTSTASNKTNSQQTPPKTLANPAQIHQPTGENSKKDSKEVEGDTESKSEDGWGGG